MNVSIVLKWLSPQQLIQEDASLSLGWIEIETDSYSIPLFEERLCMLFLTLCDLMEFLSSNKLDFDWVSVDGGDIYSLLKIKDLLVIRNESIKFEVDYGAFLKALIDTSNNTIEHILKINPSINKESAFIDFKNCLKDLVNNSS